MQDILGTKKIKIIPNNFRLSIESNLGNNPHIIYPEKF